MGKTRFHIKQILATLIVLRAFAGRLRQDLPKRGRAMKQKGCGGIESSKKKSILNEHVLVWLCCPKFEKLNLSKNPVQILYIISSLSATLIEQALVYLIQTKHSRSCDHSLAFFSCHSRKFGLYRNGEWNPLLGRCTHSKTVKPGRI